jgi:apolipoprotein N-acyltransferase
VLVANVPLERVPTVYARVGDAPAALLVVFLAGLLALALRRR